MAVCRSTMLHDCPAAMSRNMHCVVHFLDSSEGSFDIDKKEKGQLLLDKVFEHLELHERDYFGLQFTDVVTNADELVEKSNPSANHVHSEDMRWLDPVKPMRKQMRVGSPYVLYFRVKFYVPDPSMLREEYTRYQFFLQLSKDMADGRLVAPFRTTVLLASLAVQSELGDFCPAEHGVNYLNEFHFVPNQTDELLREVALMHKKHRGFSPATCEQIYIDTARYLDSYGVHLFPATWDQNNEEIQLGVTSQGLAVFQNNVKSSMFSWSKIMKISFKRKQFFIHQRKESSEHVENVFGFNMASYRSCKNLWKSCVEYHTFFCARPPAIQIADGQCHDMVELRLRSLDCQEVDDVDMVQSNMISAKCLPHANLQTEIVTTSAPLLVCSTHTVPKPLAATGMNVEQSSACPSKAIHIMSTCLSTDVCDCARTMQCANVFHHSPANGIISSGSELGHSCSCNTCQMLHNRSFVSALPTVIEQSPRSSASSVPRRSTAQNRDVTDHLMDNAVSLPATSHDRCKVNSSAERLSNSSSSDVEGIVSRDELGNNVNTAVSGTTTVQDTQTSCTDSDKSPTELSFELPPDAPGIPLGLNENLSIANHNLVTVHMKPDENGRFGFNVKGGSDQQMPVIVSRVAPNTPADLCIPRLSEGDQVLFINGRDISQHTHAQVVQFIRASCELHSGELVLVVRQNVYLGEDDSPSEPDFQYIPDTHSVITVGGDPLALSMSSLRESLESGAAVAQFEQLYRKKPGMTMDIAQRAENLPKNRYRDISPYDQTRVKLKDLKHDYINANFVNMEIPGSGIINRYIAAQGPLPETSVDFWEMVWDQCSSLVVMLTTNVERGRVKCHQYWPDVGKSTKFDHLTLTCVSETAPSSSFVLRNFTLTRANAKDDERQVCQMQYLSWPDHGVPDDCSDFLEFVSQVRLNRAGVVEPTVVHCSAGIGRTGVLIAMETAMCLIEANQAVNLTDIVRQMRDQRAMLIQTSGQFKFVCEAILKVYDEHLVEPVDEFKR